MTPDKKMLKSAKINLIGQPIFIFEKSSPSGKK
jgi:hypothetical protein